MRVALFSTWKSLVKTFLRLWKREKFHRGNETLTSAHTRRFYLSNKSNQSLLRALQKAKALVCPPALGVDGYEVAFYEREG